MKKTVVGILILAVAGGGVWFAATWLKSETPASASGDDLEHPGYDFEADGVVVRQMDPTGRLLYEVVADHVAQLAGGGAIRATGITLHHDPRGTTPGGPQRWTLTAAEAELAPGGGVVSLYGKVVARGLPKGGATPLQLTAEKLHYDLSSEDFTSDTQVEIVMGRYRARGGLLRGNVATNEWALESGVHGTISRQR